MNKHRVTLILGLLVIALAAWRLLLPAPPTRGMSVERTFVDRIGIAMGDYAVRNGQTPSTWSQIREFIDVDHWNAYSRGLECSPIEAHYIILTNKFPTPDTWTANVVLVRSTPARNRDGQLGRYYVFWDGERGGLNWVSEQTFADRVKKAGITLPGIDEKEAARAKKLLEDTRVRLD
jgi:hypothetical protein